MTRLRVLLSVLVCALLTSGWLVGQEKKEQPPARGQLPPNWKQLGLDKNQVQSIYKIQTEFKGKMDTLSQQIEKLKGQQKTELEKVLTPAQKERLREILTGKAPKDGDAPEKKPGGKDK